MTETPNITPTQELVLEVLAARHRLGESLWTFTSNRAVTVALEALEAAELVNTMGGVVERTVRASLTDTGRDLMLTPGYRLPDRALRRAGAQFLTDAAGSLPGDAEQAGLPEVYVPRVQRWLNDKADRLG